MKIKFGLYIWFENIHIKASIVSVSDLVKGGFETKLKCSQNMLLEIYDFLHAYEPDSIIINKKTREEIKKQLQDNTHG
jgi:hypothetical protein